MLYAGELPKRKHTVSYLWQRDKEYIRKWYTAYL